MRNQKKIKTNHIKNAIYHILENKEVTIDENLTNINLEKSGPIPTELLFKLFKIIAFLIALGIFCMVILFRVKPFSWRLAITLICIFLGSCLFELRTINTIVKRKYELFSGTCISVKKSVSTFFNITGKKLFVRDDINENTIYSLEIPKRDSAYEQGCHVLFYTSPYSQMIERKGVTMVIQPLLIECDKISEDEVKK